MDRRQRLFRVRVRQYHRRMKVAGAVAAVATAVLCSRPRHRRRNSACRAQVRLRLHGPRDPRHAGRRHRQSRHAVGARRRGAVEAQGWRRRQIMRRLPWRRADQHEGRGGALSRLQRGARSADRSRAAHQYLPHRPAASDAVPVREQGAARAHRLCGTAIARHADRDRRRRAHQPFLQAGRDMFNRRQGQLNLSCAQCHDDNWGQKLAGAPIPAGASDRLSALPAGMAVAWARCNGGCAIA